MTAAATGTEGLLEAFAQRARELGRLEGALTPAATFALVRDMPYRRASDRKPATIVRDWRGTCSGKHYLLADLLRGQQMEVRICVAEHAFTPETAPWLPASLRDALPPGGCPDVHTYLEVRRGGAWTAVDATWPAVAAKLGFPINRWDEPCRIAAVPKRVYRPRGDPQAYKEGVMARWIGAQMPLRERILEWIVETLGALG